MAGHVDSCLRNRRTCSHYQFGRRDRRSTVGCRRSLESLCPKMEQRLGRREKIKISDFNIPLHPCLFFASFFVIVAFWPFLMIFSVRDVCEKLSFSQTTRSKNNILKFSRFPIVDFKNIGNLENFSFFWGFSSLSETHPTRLFRKYFFPFCMKF